MEANKQEFKQPVLIVEDETDYLEILGEICDTLGIPHTDAGTGSAALELINGQTGNFSVYIVDLNLPGLHGKDLIQKIKENEPDAVIIVQTGNITSDIIIQTMKLGVFDYILKPLDFDLFQKSILKALNYKYLIEQEKLNRKKSDRIIRDQIDWINYKNSIEFKNQIEHKSLTIDHLITSLSQGAGLGSSIALLDMMEKTSEKTENGYLVEDSVYNLIFENHRFSKLHLESMNSFLLAISDRIDPKDISTIDILAEIEKLGEGLADVFQIKNQTFVMPSNNKNLMTKVDIESVKNIFTELLINAMKYSPDNSAITILTSVKDGFFWISVKNDINPSPYTGIPEKSEKLVLEPFMRLVKAVDERFAMREKFTLGLGLAAVENLVKRNNGMFIIHELEDYTSKSLKNSILAEVLLPVNN